LQFDIFPRSLCIFDIGIQRPLRGSDQIEDFIQIEPLQRRQTIMLQAIDRTFGGKNFHDQTSFVIFFDSGCAGLQIDRQLESDHGRHLIMGGVLIDCRFPFLHLLP
jgi:hypothetical protein